MLAAEPGGARLPRDHWYRFAFGRDPSAPSDRQRAPRPGPELSRRARAIAQALLLAIVDSASFRNRPIVN